MKCWYEERLLRKRHGKITWQFDDYFEILDDESQQYIIRHISKIIFE
jgi:hypothetical protein